MNSVEQYIIVSWAALIVFVVPMLLKGSVLDFSPSKGRWWPFWLYFQFLFVLPVPVILMFFSVDEFPKALRVAKDSQIFGINLLVLYAVTFFFVTLAVAIRVLPLNKLVDGCGRVGNDARIDLFSKCAVWTAIAIMILSVLFLGYRHALLDVFLTGQNLIQIRLDNRYSSSLPSQVQYVFFVSSWIAAIYAGYLTSCGKKKDAILYFSFGVLLASSGGDKGPVIKEALIFLTAFFVYRRVGVSLRLLLYGPIFLVVVGFILYFVVSLQIPDLTPSIFMTYLLNRLGVGQMSGTYDGIALGRLPGDFYLHMIPFAGLVSNYVSYDKALMMTVEGYAFTEMGVKNSFFISEAFGIGGYNLVLVSPFIVGICWALGCAIIYYVLRLMFGECVAKVYFLPMSIFSQNLTGGFSSFPLFKGIILLVMVFGIYFFVYKIFGRIKVFKRRRFRLS